LFFSASTAHAVKLKSAQPSKSLDGNAILADMADWTENRQPPGPEARERTRTGLMEFLGRCVKSGHSGRVPGRGKNDV